MDDLDKQLAELQLLNNQELNMPLHGTLGKKVGPAVPPKPKKNQPQVLFYFFFGFLLIPDPEKKSLKFILYILNVLCIFLRGATIIPSKATLRTLVFNPFTKYNEPTTGFIFKYSRIRTS